MDPSLPAAWGPSDEGHVVKDAPWSFESTNYSGEGPLQRRQLAGVVDEAVNKVLSRVEKLFRDQKVELEAKDAIAEKNLRARTKKEKKEREEERKELVEMIREMALELEDRDDEIEEPVILKDAVGRKFIFPYDSCKTWTGFEALVKQAFLHIEIIGPQVSDGYYDILSPKGMVILPSVWDNVIEPGWEISMHMWPLADNWKQDNFREPEIRILNECGPPSPPPPPAPQSHKAHRLHDIVEEDRIPGKFKRYYSSPEPPEVLEKSVSEFDAGSRSEERVKPDYCVAGRRSEERVKPDYCDAGSWSEERVKPEPLTAAEEHPGDWDVLEPF